MDYPLFFTARARLPRRVFALRLRLDRSVYKVLGMPTSNTRDRLVRAMTQSLQRRGLHGMGLTELLGEAGAPKGVLYHHFPGGKAELAVHAIVASVDTIEAGISQALAAGLTPWQAMEAWMQGAEDGLQASGFERGCPLATVALESTPADIAIRDALASGFAAIRQRVADALADRGMAQPTAQARATLLVAAYEGALIQARVAGSVEPLRQVREALAPMFSTQEPTP